MLPDGTADAYVQMTYSGQTLRSKVVKMEKKLVEWNQEMLIPVELPIKEEKISFKVYDQDPVIDEQICSFELSIIDLLDLKQPKIKWIDLYGPHNPQGIG